MTWLELAKQIPSWTVEQQNQDVTVHLQLSDEYFGASGDQPAVTLEITSEEADVLDGNSYYLDIGG